MSSSTLRRKPYDVKVIQMQSHVTKSFPLSRAVLKKEKERKGKGWLR